MLINEYASEGRWRQAWNTDPIPFFDWTATFPPNSLLIILVIERPSPTPFVFNFLVLEMVPNSLKSFSYSSSLMPIPESMTERTILSFYSGRSIWITAVFLSSKKDFFLERLNEFIKESRL